jgi:hypothetical protein
MTSDVVPRACHQTETLLRCLRMRTPKVLIMPASGSAGAKGQEKRRLTLDEKNCGVDSDRLARIRLVVCTDRSCRGDEVGACEAGSEEGSELVEDLRVTRRPNNEPDSRRHCNLPQ